MTWHVWVDQLRQAPELAVADLLRGAADVSPFERATPHDFLLALLPRRARVARQQLLGAPVFTPAEMHEDARLAERLDTGLCDWLVHQRESFRPVPRKLGAYAAMLCEALQLPLYFDLPRTSGALHEDRWRWLSWCRPLTVSAYRDPEYDYWQVLACRQPDDALQSIWQSFIIEAGRSRFERYVNLGLLSLGKLPLSEEDSLRNLRLQVQALLNRYQSRRQLGPAALTEMSELLRGVLARNPSLSSSHCLAFLRETLAPLGENKIASLLNLVGLANSNARASSRKVGDSWLFKLLPPGSLEDTERVLEAIRRSTSSLQAWRAMAPLVTAHEDYLRKSGDPYYFARTLDRAVRAFCGKHELREPEIQGRVFQWIHTVLRLESDDPRRWMLWVFALRKAGYAHRAEWVLWEMTRRFPENGYCRVELASLLLDAGGDDNERRASELLEQALRVAPEDLHTIATFAHLEVRRERWDQALSHAAEVYRRSPDSRVGVVLLASAYEGRNKPGDLDLAVDHLQRFVVRNPDDQEAQGRLRRLAARKESGAAVQQTIRGTDVNSTGLPSPLDEPDPAWRLFANSIEAWVRGSQEDPDLTPQPGVDEERVVPLPYAMLRAVEQGRSFHHLAETYEEEAQKQLPLETRLWLYLEALRTPAYASDSDRLKAELGFVIEREISAADSDDSEWSRYLRRQWEQLSQATTSDAVAFGTEWLTQLLGRYRSLPTPLLV